MVHISEENCRLLFVYTDSHLVVYSMLAVYTCPRDYIITFNLMVLAYHLYILSFILAIFHTTMRAY